MGIGLDIIFVEIVFFYLFNVFYLDFKFMDDKWN